jgi:hypothetical protein
VSIEASLEEEGKMKIHELSIFVVIVCAGLKEEKDPQDETTFSPSI